MIPKEALESYSSSILTNCLGETKKVQIDLSERVLLFATSETGENHIDMGRYASSLMLLFSCYTLNKKLFQRTLYLYYWASKSIVERKIGKCVFFLTKLREELCSKIDKMQWYAKTIHLDLLLYFVIGHETFHLIYKHNSGLKQDAIQDIDLFLNDMIENRIKSNRIADRLLNESLEALLKDDACKEELACDKNSILFMSKHVLSSRTDDEQSFETICQQLMDMQIMLLYNDINASDLRRDVRISNIRSFILSQHYLVTRLWITALTLQEIETADLNLYSCLNRANNSYTNLYSRKLRIKFKEYGFSNSNELGQLTENDLLIRYRQQMGLIADLIFNMLVGERFENEQ